MKLTLVSNLLRAPLVNLISTICGGSREELVPSPPNRDNFFFYITYMYIILMTRYYDYIIFIMNELWTLTVMLIVF